MKLLHGADDVGDVLDDVDGAQLIEGAVAEGIGEPIEVAEDVGAGMRVAVDPDGSWDLVDSAAHVEHTGNGGFVSQFYLCEPGVCP